jgi:hypothetical protein
MQKTVGYATGSTRPRRPQYGSGFIASVYNGAY